MGSAWRGEGDVDTASASGWPWAGTWREADMDAANQRVCDESRVAGSYPGHLHVCRVVDIATPGGRGDNAVLV